MAGFRQRCRASADARAGREARVWATWPSVPRPSSSFRLSHARCLRRPPAPPRHRECLLLLRRQRDAILALVGENQQWAERKETLVKLINTWLKKNKLYLVVDAAASHAVNKRRSNNDMCATPSPRLCVRVRASKNSLGAELMGENNFCPFYET